MRFELYYNGNGLRCHLDDDSFWQKLGDFFTKEVTKLGLIKKLKMLLWCYLTMDLVWRFSIVSKLSLKICHYVWVQRFVSLGSTIESVYLSLSLFEFACMYVCVKLCLSKFEFVWVFIYLSLFEYVWVYVYLSLFKFLFVCVYLNLFENLNVNLFI